MVLIRSKSTLLSQSQVLYQNIYEKLKIPNGDYQKLVEVVREDKAPFYRKNTYPAQNIIKSGGIQHQGMQYPSSSVERTEKPQQIGISDGVKRQINQTTLNKQLPIDKNWIARMLHSFSEANIDVDSMVKDLHHLFCDTYSFGEGEFIFDEEIQDYK
jgi:hypothetical protein